MNIVLVGGHDRMHEEYKEVGNKYGCKMKVFTRMPSRFDKFIGEPEAIVLFTNTVSHKMVITAMKEAKRKNIHVLRCHNSSKNSLETVLMTLKETVAYGAS